MEEPNSKLISRSNFLQQKAESEERDSESQSSDHSEDFSEKSYNVSKLLSSFEKKATSNRSSPEREQKLYDKIDELIKVNIQQQSVVSDLFSASNLIMMQLEQNAKMYMNNNNNNYNNNNYVAQGGVNASLNQARVKADFTPTPSKGFPTYLPNTLREEKKSKKASISRGVTGRSRFEPEDPSSSDGSSRSSSDEHEDEESEDSRHHRRPRRDSRRQSRRRDEPSNRRESILKSIVNTNVNPRNTINMYMQQPPYNHITLSSLTLPGIFSFMEQVNEYQSKNGIALPLPTMLSRQVRDQVLSRNNPHLSENKFWSLTADELLDYLIY